MSTISREAAISELVNMVTDHYKDEPFHGLMLHWTGIKAMLEALPSAEQEIIRCKDCLMHGVCRFEQGLGLDGYCSQAEKHGRR